MDAYAAVGPIIADLQDPGTIAHREVERVRGKLGALTPQQEQAIEQLTRGIVNKIAHGPIAALRRNAGDVAIDRIRNIFRLDEEAETADKRRKACWLSDHEDRSLRCGRRTTFRRGSPPSGWRHASK